MIQDMTTVCRLKLRTDEELANDMVEVEVEVDEGGGNIGDKRTDLQLFYL